MVYLFRGWNIFHFWYSRKWRHCYQQQQQPLILYFMESFSWLGSTIVHDSLNYNFVCVCVWVACVSILWIDFHFISSVVNTFESSPADAKLSNGLEFYLGVVSSKQIYDQCPAKSQFSHISILWLCLYKVDMSWYVTTFNTSETVTIWISITIHNIRTGVPTERY